MIDQSEYWKKPLVRAANWMKRAKFDLEDTSKIEVRLEREIFIGFYAIRKLSETPKVTDRTKALQFTLKYVKFDGVPDLNWWNVALDYKHDTVLSEERSLTFLCNLFIHSHIYNPMVGGDHHIQCIYVTSDYTRFKKLYIVDLEQIILAFKSVGQDDPRKVSIVRNPVTGKFDTTVE